MTYKFDECIEAKQLNPIYKDDICGGTVENFVNFCANKPGNMLTDAVYDPSGTILIVARLLGEITYYIHKSADEIIGPYDLVNINVDFGGIAEFGLTGVNFSTTFDSDGYIFFGYNTVQGVGESRVGVGRVERYKLTIDNTNASITDKKVIYERTGSDLLAAAHNLHLATAINIKNQNFIIISYGDLNKASKFCQNSEVDFGKLLIMDSDGSSPKTSVYDTKHDNNMHFAYGNRNLFKLYQIPKDIDKKERFIWMENGNGNQRGCIYNFMDQTQSHNMEWTNGAEVNKWVQMTDTNGSNSVLFFESDTTGVVMSIFNKSQSLKLFPSLDFNSMAVLHTYLSPTHGPPNRTRCISLEYFGNLNNAPQPVGFVHLKKLVWTEENYITSPLATIIHPITGNFVFGDIMNGNLYSCKFISQPVFEIVVPTNDDNDWASSVPWWFWLIFAIIAVVLLVLFVLLTYLIRWPDSKCSIWLKRIQL
jgi:hypothetical protein